MRSAPWMEQGALPQRQSLCYFYSSSEGLVVHQLVYRSRWPSIRSYHNYPVWWPGLETHTMVSIHTLRDRLGTGDRSMRDSGCTSTCEYNDTITHSHDSGLQPNSTDILSGKAANTVVSLACHWRASNCLGSQTRQSMLCDVPNRNQWWACKAKQILLTVRREARIHLSPW